MHFTTLLPAFLIMLIEGHSAFQFNDLFPCPSAYPSSFCSRKATEDELAQTKFSRFLQPPNWFENKYSCLSGVPAHGALAYTETCCKNDAFGKQKSDFGITEVDLVEGGKCTIGMNA
ncbi:hypothetical protein MJO28_005515 [Puccinia striiformis f. sp. tritici]|uniref:Uncharacterized protein n=3 Tax=Puccinia striiformis TaxID=27350 RepID=A0ACC0EL38_9BASI